MHSCSTRRTLKCVNRMEKSRLVACGNMEGYAAAVHGLVAPQQSINQPMNHNKQWLPDTKKWKKLMGQFKKKNKKKKKNL
jgi:hypothetical protein